MTSLRNRLVWLGAVGAIVAVTALLLGFAEPAAPSSGPDAVQEASETVVPDRRQLTIQVGLYIVNIHQFSMRDKVYNVEGWYWLRWPQGVQDIMNEVGTNRERMIEFLNLVETPKIDNDPDTDDPQLMSDGHYFWEFKFRESSTWMI